MNPLLSSATRISCDNAIWLSACHRSANVVFDASTDGEFLQFATTIPDECELRLRHQLAEIGGVTVSRNRADS